MGGVCVCINNRWRNNVTVKYHHCSGDRVDQCWVSTYYLRREKESKPTICYCGVYQPRANVNNASAKIHEIIQQLEIQSWDSVNLVTGDFNNCELKAVLPRYCHYIDKCNPPREGPKLDKCFERINKAFKAYTKTGLGSSDHVMAHPVPEYRRNLKQETMRQAGERVTDNTGPGLITHLLSTCLLEGTFGIDKSDTCYGKWE